MFSEQEICLPGRVDITMPSANTKETNVEKVLSFIGGKNKMLNKAAKQELFLLFNDKAMLGKLSAEQIEHVLQSQLPIP